MRRHTSVLAILGLTAICTSTACDDKVHLRAATYNAGLATGFWGSAEELAANWQVDRRFEPQMDPAEASERNERWARAVERAGAWESG